MDLNLLLSAQILVLAPQIKCSEEACGLTVVKNVPARTYLRVTPEQWKILIRFEEPRMVPKVLDEAIRERQCLPLGEFYELILKALEAKILLDPDTVPEPVVEHDWNLSVRPRFLGKILALILVVGIALTFVFHPRLPGSVADAAIGLLLLVASLSFGEFVAACMLRGAGVHVYRPRFRLMFLPPHFAADLGEIVMLPFREQRAILLAVPSALAAAAGVAAWRRPEWALLPLAGLLLSLRPVVEARVLIFLRKVSWRELSDAEHSYLFPPNQNPAARARVLRRALCHPTTWARVGYGVIWTLVILYWTAVFSSLPTWGYAFWKANGLRIGAATGASLLILGSGYAAWETFQWAHGRARSWRRVLRIWRTRWFAGNDVLIESNRMKVLSSSPLFERFSQSQRQDLARSMTVVRRGPWSFLPEHSGKPTRVSVIVSGTIGVSRIMADGKSARLQVLREGDVVGLHDLADPGSPDYRLRTRTPVTLLTIERSAVEEMVVQCADLEALADTLLKLPFIRRISLCQNWHMQATSRFARLSSIVDLPKGTVIMKEDATVEDFYVIFQGDAKVSRYGRNMGTIRAGQFFGEIGLLQNSAASATVTAQYGTRCLRIPRRELLQFVTHNYSVALELERVSSERLGRPIFPLRRGDFRAI